MKLLKMSLENIQGKMSRNEMRNIMAGSGGTNCNSICRSNTDCRGDFGCLNCKSVPNWSMSVCVP